LHLSEAQSLDLLRIAGETFIPPSVAIEAKRYIPEWHNDQPAWIVVTELVEPNLNEAQTWRQSGILDAGEAEALALARQLHADWFLTDDTAARVMAASLAVEAHGSLGLVLWSAATHLQRDEAEQKLDALVASSLWISAAVVAEARSALNRLFDRPKE
jgi:predicted nucleic acid-binding protein